VAAASTDADLAESLAAAGCHRALVDTARELADREAAQVLERTAAAGWRWLTPSEPEYPSLLQSTADPPLGLFVRGRLHDGPKVAVVGSRKATPYGRQVARLLGEELGRAGVIVVSGMARGVDAAAHRGALAEGGRSWAVWGCGPDHIYPPEHADLAEELVQTGAVVTEYPPGTPPRRHHFPQRNRILAGVAAAVVVVEAAARSGALITARQAADEGRDVLAVPGSIFSDLSVGPNALLRIGAKPLVTLRDLFEVVGCSPEPSSDPAIGGLLQAIGPGESVTADDLARRAGRGAGEVAAELLRLEMSGDVERGPDGRFSRVRVAAPEEPAGHG
jgi:DNA processing protein